MKETMVLYTGAGAGHLKPMVALAKSFTEYGFSATIVTYDHPSKPGFAAQEAERISSTNPLISFHIIPNISTDSQMDPRARNIAILHGNNPNLLEFLTSLSKTESVRAVVLDFLCNVALDVTNQLSIPTYFFIAFGASDLAVFLHLLELDETSTVSLKDMGRTMITFPGICSIPACDMPIMLLDRNVEIYKWFLEMMLTLIKGDGFLINSFEALEPKAVAALREGSCLSGRTIPPIYCIGPMVNGGQKKEGEERHEALTWLDSQPKKSVIFLCFGSMGGFLPDQIKKIAIGLENSGQRFLWVVKVASDTNNMFEFKPDVDLLTLLPEGFLDRTKDRGMIIKLWAPQVQILQHEAVGGFVSHCGWNSTLEAITYGVPMICWPLYAEQRINKTFLVEEIKIGVEMEGYDKGMVEAEEVEKKVKWLMESEESMAIKERVVIAKENAEAALREDGSSSQAFFRFLEDVRGKSE